MKLSIVTTLYKSEEYIQEFYERITKATRPITNDYEVIFVDDGSPDNSLLIAKQIQALDPHIVIIELSRNFGHHRAIMTGLLQAKSEYIFLLDSDLEEDPELLTNFWEVLSNSKNVDVICGIQAKRNSGFFEKWSSILFGKIVNVLSGFYIPENIVLMRLMTRRYLDNLLRHTERELAFVGIAALTGFQQEYLEINKRCKGISTYTLRKKINLALNYITCLSSKPLVYIFYIGFLITFSSLIFLLYIIYNKLIFNTHIGWTSLIASIWFFGGLITFCIGIIGIYLSKIFIEIKNRPYTIIKELHTSNSM